MTITRYSHWNQPHRFQDELKQVFDRFFSDDETDQSNVVTSQWLRRHQEEKRFVILADIPGVDPKEIDISMDKGILAIRGERKSENKEQNGKTTRVERSYGAFARAGDRRRGRRVCERQNVFSKFRFRKNPRRRRAGSASATKRIVIDQMRSLCWPRADPIFGARARRRFSLSAETVHLCWTL